MFIERAIKNAVISDLKKKMVFVAGPRQCGKTTFAKKIATISNSSTGTYYLNWDYSPDRTRILNGKIPITAGLIIFDEIHKYSDWRTFIKGIYDKFGNNLNILITGSARLDHYRKGGDSLQGRYHFHRLLPFTLSELNHISHSSLIDLFTYGGFPEPFIAQSEIESRRWSLEYRTRLIREDLIDLENIREIDKLEQLSMRLPQLVGSPLSINAIREDLNVSHRAVQRWVSILENIYMIFRIYPFGAPTIRAVKKEAKHYQYDWTLVKESGLRFENMVALHLLAETFKMRDQYGRVLELRYFRDTDRREVDFVIQEDSTPLIFIECKNSKKNIGTPFKYLCKKFPKIPAVQVVFDDFEEFVDLKTGIRVIPAFKFLENIGKYY